ncbi:MAG: DUF721 domain-containing protein [Leptospiraceae bacterium]|nr:DUF721 domain-containing protein [Leptospiraceae bacterium]
MNSFDMESDDFSSLLSKLEIDFEKLKSEVEFRAISDHWKDIVGLEFYKFSRPKKIIRDTLYIGVYNSAYKMELQFVSNLLIQNINKYSKNRISKIRLDLDTNIIIPKVVESKKNHLDGKENLICITEREKDETTRKKLLSLIKVF